MKVAKLKFLEYLEQQAIKKEPFVPLDSIPDFGDNKTIAESLLREGLIGVERLEKGMNCVLLMDGHKFLESAKKQDR